MFHKKNLVQTAVFGFVSGHDFSRAVDELKEIGL